MGCQQSKSAKGALQSDAHQHNHGGLDMNTLQKETNNSQEKQNSEKNPTRRRSSQKEELSPVPSFVKTCSTDFASVDDASAWPMQYSPDANGFLSSSGGGLTPSIAPSLSSTQSQVGNVPYTMLILRNRLIEMRGMSTSKTQQDKHKQDPANDVAEDAMFWSTVMDSLLLLNPPNTPTNTHHLHEQEQAAEAEAAASAASLLFNYVDPYTGSTPMHEACKLSNPALDVMRLLLEKSGGPPILRKRDKRGCIPLHYAITVGQVSGEVIQMLLQAEPQASFSYLAMQDGETKTKHNKPNTPEQELTLQTNMAHAAWKKTTPLYHAIRLRKDNAIIQAIHGHCPQMLCMPTYVATNEDDDEESNSNSNANSTTPRSKRRKQRLQAHLHQLDTPLNLLWRRYHNQKWQCERYFAGDNSRSSVVRHRSHHRTLATETRDVIMAMLQGMHGNPGRRSSDMDSSSWGGRIVHAVAYLCYAAPLDLVQVILMKNPGEIGEQDEKGRLPLHYAAMARPVPEFTESDFFGTTAQCKKRTQVVEEEEEEGWPAHYGGKFVVETLLRLCPSAAQVRDNEGKLPLTLALENHCSAPRNPNSNSNHRSTSNSMDMTVIQLLYNAYPAAIENAKNGHKSRVEPWRIQKVLRAVQAEARQGEGSDGEEEDGREEEEEIGLGRALFLVQRPEVSPRYVVSAMWAFRTDASLQLLSLVSLAKYLASRDVVEVLNGREGAAGGAAEDEDEEDDMRFVNQEDDEEEDQGKNGISANTQRKVQRAASVRVALSGGVPAVIGAMTSHPGEAIVQERACRALRLMSSASNYNRHEINLCSVGAISAVIRAMQDNPTDVMVQAEGCAALGVVGSNVDAYTTVASTGGIAMIVSSMEAHPAERVVQVEGCRALRKLSVFANDEVPLYNAEELRPLLGNAVALFDDDCRDSVDVIMRMLH